MNAVRKAVVRFMRDERGTETLEWGLICGLIVVGAIATIVTIGPKISSLWTNINSSFETVK
jgi:Flp pilus assembly pilin Flp